MPGEHRFHRLADEVPRHRVGTLLLPFVHQFDLARERRHHGLQIQDARMHRLLPCLQGAPLQVGEQVLVRSDGNARRHPARLVDELAAPGLEGHLLDDLPEVVGHLEGDAALRPGLLVGDPDGIGQALRVVGQDLGGDAILEGGDDVAPVGVVLGIGGEHHEDVDGQTHGEAADLEILLFHDVEQAHLDAWLQVGELVESKDAAVRARHNAEVDDFLVGEGEPITSRLDGIDVADQVGDGHIRRGELLVVALVTVQPGEGQFVARVGRLAPAALADGRVGVVVDLTAGHRRDPLVEQFGQLAQETGLRLAAQAEEEEIVLGEKGVLQLRDDRVLVADDAGEDGLAVALPAHEVAPELFLHRQRPRPGTAESTERL